MGKFTPTSTSNGNKEFFNGYPEYIDLLQNISEVHVEQQSDDEEPEIQQESNDEIQNLLESNQNDYELYDNSQNQLEPYQHQMTLKSDSKSPENRRSKKERDKRVFYSDLNEYLGQDYDKNQYTEETPDQFGDEKEQSLKTFENSPNLMPRPHSEDEDAIAHLHSDKKSKESDLRDTLSFANKSQHKESSQKQNSSKDISPESHENQLSEGMSSPGIGKKFYRVSPEDKKHESMNSKNKAKNENNAMKFEYPSFGEGHPSKQSSLEGSRHFEESKENEEVKEELQSYIQFLVSKYDVVQDKAQLENLLLEIHHLNSLNLDKVPDDFRNKVNEFVQNSILAKQHLETPKKEESKLIKTESKKYHSPDPLAISQVSQPPKNGDTDART